MTDKYIHFLSNSYSAPHVISERVVRMPNPQLGMPNPQLGAMRPRRLRMAFVSSSLSRRPPATLYKVP